MRRSNDPAGAATITGALVALTEGVQSAFVASAVLAGIAVPPALTLLGPPRKAPQQRLEPLAATGAAS